MPPDKAALNDIDTMSSGEEEGSPESDQMVAELSGVEPVVTSSDSQTLAKPISAEGQGMVDELSTPQPSWFETLTNRFGADSPEDFSRKANAAAAGGEEMKRQLDVAGSSPWEAAKFAGRTGLHLGGQLANSALNLYPASSVVRRMALGGLGEAVEEGTRAYNEGADWGDIANRGLDAFGRGSLVQGGFEGAGAVADYLGGAAKGGANRRLANRAYPPKERRKLLGTVPRDATATSPARPGGIDALKQAGQELRDTGITKARGVRDYLPWGPSMTERMQGNALDILKRENEAAHAASTRIMDAPWSEDMTVGDSPANFEPVGNRLRDRADYYDDTSLPDVASRYRKVANRITRQREPVQVERMPDHPAQPPPLPQHRIDVPSPSSQPLELMSRQPPTPDVPAGMPSRTPPEPMTDPMALSSEPLGAMETPSSPGYQGDYAISMPPPSQTPEGVIERFPARPKPYQANTPQVSQEPILDQAPIEDFGQQMRGLKRQAPLMSEPPDLAQLDVDMRGLPAKSPEVDQLPYNGPLELENEPPRTPMSQFDQGMDVLNHNAGDIPNTAPMRELEFNSRVAPPGADTENLLGSGPIPSQWREPGSSFTPEPMSATTDPAALEMGSAANYWSGPEANTPPDLDLREVPEAPIERFPSREPTTQPSLQLDMPRQRDVNLPRNFVEAPLELEQPYTPSQRPEPPAAAPPPVLPDPIDVDEPNLLEPQPPITRNTSDYPASFAPSDDAIDVPPPEGPWQQFTTAELPKTLKNLANTRREYGNRIKEFGGRPLNQVENDTNAANFEAYKGLGDAFTSELDQHMGHGNIRPADVNEFRRANKTFSTVADVNNNLAGRVDQEYNKAENAAPTGNESSLGTAYKAAHSAKGPLRGINSQYAIGQGLEGMGDFLRMGYRAQNVFPQHPEIEEAQQANPGASQASILSKANDAMKDKVSSWYNSLIDKAYNKASDLASDVGEYISR